jgi:arabinosaccharide transport system permease protein
MKIRQRRIAPYVFISPFFIGYAFFFLYPVVSALYMSLFRQVGIGSMPKFIGLGNYVNLLHDPTFLRALTNTTYYAVGSLFIILPAALLLGLAFNMRHLHIREFFRLFFFTPMITSGVVVAIIFGLVFNAEYGLINNWLLVPLGLGKVRWLLDPLFIMPAIIILGLWRYTGLNALYFLASLQAIPTEVTEAATIDGASRWQVFRHITLPMLRPVILFVVIVAIIGSYNLFAEPYMLVGGEGGPSNGGLFMTMYLYLNGFRYMKFGYAAAIGYTLTIIIMVLSLIQLRLLGIFRED